MLSPPEIHQPDTTQLHKRIPALEPVILGIDQGSPRIEVTQHDERPSGAASQPGRGDTPECRDRRPCGRSVDGGEPQPGVNYVQLEPASRIEPGLRGPRPSDARERDA